MRTTIELKDEHRAALLELAARRKEKGFSNLIGEAVDLYLKEVPSEEAKRRAVSALRGSLSKKEAEAMRRRIREIRSRWR